MENCYFACCCSSCALYFEIEEHGKTEVKSETKTVGKTSNSNQNDPRFCVFILSYQSMIKLSTSTSRIDYFLSKKKSYYENVAEST